MTTTEKNTLNKTIDDDPDGVKYWTDELNSGKSRAEVVIALINALKTYKDSTGKTKEAYDQFMNRVKVSNEMADKVYKAPSDYKTSTSFSDGLPVTFDISTVTNAMELVDLIRENRLTDVSGESTVSNSDGSQSANTTNTTNNTTTGTSGQSTASSSNSSGGSGGSQSSNSENNVTIVADAGEDQNVTFGETVYFDASKSKSNKGEIVSYTWKYGTYVYITKKAKKSGSSSKLKIGTFEVTLIVTDDKGNTATDTLTITIHN